MGRKICYCFNYNQEEIRQDVRNNNGESTILEKILAAKRQGSCHCATKHPEGR